VTAVAEIANGHERPRAAVVVFWPIFGGRGLWRSLKKAWHE